MLGVPKAALDDMIGVERIEPHVYELWPEHERAWWVYLGCASQWRIALSPGVALWLGLDYDGVQRVMQHYGVPPDEQGEVFLQVQVLEDEERCIRNR